MEIDKSKFGRVCSHGDCLQDSVYHGKCRYHAGPIPCANCPAEKWEHIEVAPDVLLCPTAVYKEER